MPQIDSPHLDAVREAKRRRLEVLELQEASLGRETPPHVATEIADLRKELVGVEAVTNPSISKETVDALQQYGQLRAILVTVMGLVADVSELKRRMDADDDKRDARQHRVDMLFLALFLSYGFLAIIVLVR